MICKEQHTNVPSANLHFFEKSSMLRRPIIPHTYIFMIKVSLTISQC